jgi:hypothetical protein
MGNIPRYIPAKKQKPKKSAKNDYNGPPIAGPQFACMAPEDDPLLKRLIEHHGASAQKSRKVA